MNQADIIELQVQVFNQPGQGKGCRTVTRGCEDVLIADVFREPDRAGDPDEFGVGK